MTQMRRVTIVALVGMATLAAAMTVSQPAQAFVGALFEVICIATGKCKT